MTVGLDIGFGNQNSTQHPTITGSCSTTFDALFNPTTHAATIQDATFNLQQPGQVSLQNVTFSYSWVFGLVTENIATTSVLASPYTPTPPSAVSGGLFPANQVAMVLNGGNLGFSGDASGSYGPLFEFAQCGERFHKLRHAGDFRSHDERHVGDLYDDRDHSYGIEPDGHRLQRQRELHGDRSTPAARCRRSARSSSISAPAR